MEPCYFILQANSSIRSESAPPFPVSRIQSVIQLPSGLSFFDPHLQYFTKETLNAGGSAYISKNHDGTVSGLFIYDKAERAGTIFTRSKEVFDYFYQMKQFRYVFSEMESTYPHEVYDIYTMSLAELMIKHKFRYEISISREADADELSSFMALTHSKINPRWARAALENGDLCIMTRFNDEIIGAGWVSLVNSIGRLHTLYVKPPFRRMGIGEDILWARLLWLKRMGAHSVYTEIARSNVASAGNVMKAGMNVAGRMFQYFPPAKSKAVALNGGLFSRVTNQ